MVQPGASLADPDRGLRWGVERRMEFIDFRLYWEGRINRADLMRFFGVSVQQASADIARYQELAPDNLTYDRSAKRYLAGADYRPVFKVDDSDRYLAQLRSLGEKLIQPEEAWMAEIPSFQTLPLPSRPIDPAILRAVDNGDPTENRDRGAVSVDEPARSAVAMDFAARRRLRRPSLACPRLLPHRWFLQGFRIRQDPRDSGTRSGDVDPARDRAWIETVPVVIAPHPDLSQAQRKTIALDYGMVDSVRVIQVRRAFLLYFLQHLRLDDDCVKPSPGRTADRPRQPNRNHGDAGGGSPCQARTGCSERGAMNYLPAQDRLSYLDELNPAQRAAVVFGVAADRPARSTPPLLVIAGAGSGKTSTLAHRVAHLILNGADPRRILLLTFARRMAAEMTRRVERICATALNGHATVASDAIEWSGTFHAVGAKLLRLYAESIGLEPGFSILDRSDAADLMDLVRDELELSKTGGRFPKKATCLAIYSYAVNAQIPVRETLDRAFPWCAEWAEPLKGLFARYVETKQAQAVLDYDDLLLYWSQMMQIERDRTSRSPAASITSWSTSTRTPTPCRRRSCSV